MQDPQDSIEHEESLLQQIALLQKSILELTKGLSNKTWKHPIISIDLYIEQLKSTITDLINRHNKLVDHRINKREGLSTSLAPKKYLGIFII